MEQYQSFSFNGERRDYILMPVGRKRPAWAPVKRNFINIKGNPGARLLNTDIEVRQIDVPLIVKGENIADLQKVKEDLAAWLVTDRECELIFDDEPDRTYIALVDGGFDADEAVNRGKGVVTFIAAMPYKLGPVNKFPFVQNWSTETTASFINKGSEEAPAYIEIIAKKPSTFLDVWFGAYPKDRNYFRIGYPITVAEKPAQERERVLWDDMSRVIGWTSVKGKFEEMTGTADFKVRDGHALYCENYGEGTNPGFHGALAKKNIPGGPIQDFEMEAWVQLKSNRREEMGRIEVLLLDDSSNIIARINMNDLYWDAEITRAYMRVGNESTPGSIRKLIDTSGAHPNTFNQFRGRLRIARRGKKWSVYVARFKDGTNIDDASLVEPWNDESNNPMTNRKVAQVMIAICKYDSNEAVSNMCIEDLKIWKVNNMADNTKPFIFEAGDKIIIDSETSAVTINGKKALNIKDIFSEFPVVIKGQNRIDIMPADHEATISFRERYK